MGLGCLPERPALARPTAWPVGNTGLCNRAVHDHLKFRDYNRDLWLPEFYCAIVRAVPNGKGESCDHILELIDRKNVLLLSIFSSNRGSSLITPTSTTSTTSTAFAQCSQPSGGRPRWGTAKSPRRDGTASCSPSGVL